MLTRVETVGIYAAFPVEIGARIYERRQFSRAFGACRGMGIEDSIDYDAARDLSCSVSIRSFFSC